MSNARALAIFAVVLGAGLAAFARADAEHHTLWRIQGRHNTVYLLGSIHVLRDRDYPLPAAMMEAYSQSKAVVMEIDLNEMDSQGIQQEMLEAAMLPEGKTLHDILGAGRYDHAKSLAAAVGVDLAMFDQFAPWFVAEAISQVQLMQLGFAPTSGVEMYFLDKARTDNKATGGLETAHDQIELFESMSAERQADYLVSSLEEAKSLPSEVDAMVGAWRRGDTEWFASQLEHEFGRDPRLFQSVLAARNRKWIPKIEALLTGDKNYLVIVGAGHLVGHDSVIELLKQDGIGATQQ
jgi:uncharacterized protein YbaP (TraB family)